MSQAVDRGGLLVAFLMALSAMAAARRLLTALLDNHRYRFTTWRWALALTWMLALAALLKVGLCG